MLGQDEVEVFGKEDNDVFFIEESLFMHLNNERIWALGISAINIRDSNTLEYFVTKYFSPGNNIVTDGWTYICYSHKCFYKPKYNYFLYSVFDKE